MLAILADVRLRAGRFVTFCDVFTVGSCFQHFFADPQGSVGGGSWLVGVHRGILSFMPQLDPVKLQEKQSIFNVL